MTGRVFITGDKHGSFLPLFGLVEKNKITENDILIIAGDAEYVWNEDYIYRVETLQQTFPGIIAFIDGNHENHALLNSMEIRKWNGGRVHKVGHRVLHLMRGEIYSINRQNIFTFGGARSNDRDRRIEGESWWLEEEPTLEEFEYGRKQLMENLDKIDYVITHETPMSAREVISRKKQIDEDYHLPAMLESWYQMISTGDRFKKWYCGHMHVNQQISPQLRAVHSDILLIGDENPVRWA